MSRKHMSSAGGLSRRVVEVLAKEAYSEGPLTEHQVGKLFGLESGFETEAFFKKRGAPSDYTSGDLEEDRRRLRGAEPTPK
jgi:Uncharacterised protein family (UPF0175)